MQCSLAYCIQQRAKKGALLITGFLAGSVIAKQGMAVVRNLLHQTLSLEVIGGLSSTKRAVSIISCSRSVSASWVRLIKVAGLDP